MKHPHLGFILLGIYFSLLSSEDIHSKNKRVENFIFYSVDGKRQDFYDLIKSLPINCIIILNFTSIYCKPCRNEIPKLLEIAGKAGNRAKVICIYSECGNLVKENACLFNIVDSTYVDPFGNIRKQFNVKAVPVTFIISNNFLELNRFDGYTEDNIKNIENIIFKP